MLNEVPRTTDTVQNRKIFSPFFIELKTMARSVMQCYVTGYFDILYLHLHAY